MRKNIIFALFGVVCLMMPVDANASCSYATNSPASTDGTGVMGPYMIVLRHNCSDKDKDIIFYHNTALSEIQSLLRSEKDYYIFYP